MARGFERTEAAIQQARRGSIGGAQDQEAQRAMARVIDQYLGRRLQDMDLMKERLEVLFGVRGAEADHAVRWGSLMQVRDALNEIAERDSGWRTPTLINGWEDYGGEYGPIAYRRLASGLVVIEGLIRNGTVGTSTAAFNLPPGFRPRIRQIFFPGTSGLNVARLDVRPNGDVITHTGNASWFSVSCTFYASL